MAGSAADRTALELGARGAFRGAPFVLSSRTEVSNAGGATWNEWRLTFDDGRVGWLAEALGVLTLYFEGALAPPFDALEVGGGLTLDWTVVERGTAIRLKTWGGESPGKRTYAYADLSGRDGRRATVDYGEREPIVFVGQTVTLTKLGLTPRPGGAPLVAVSGGRTSRDGAPALEVGAEGTLAGAKVRVRGVMQRTMRTGGETATWDEYLLDAGELGLRWLTCADGHWNFVAPVEPGLVRESADGERATYDGETYRAFGNGTAKVSYLAGELPWPARVGDASEVCDFVCAPRVLSCEWTDDEISWSLGIYTEPDAILRAFGRRALPKPRGRAPNQPRKAAKSSRR
ncbi:MAG: DUF4178 domain-containing protein [Myxococcales bacterium]|nr:DUF4178 domain-containing protein [Myxococcales bacterium]